MNTEAILAALEQARAALDEVQSSMVATRKAKPAMPAEAPLTCPECGKPSGECACEDEAEPAEME
jgi:hypothetical protein